MSLEGWATTEDTEIYGRKRSLSALPEPAPPKNAVDYTVLRPRPGEVEKWKGGKVERCGWKGGKVERFAQSASTALGVECVLRKSLGREAMHRMKIESDAGGWGGAPFQKHIRGLMEVAEVSEG